MSCTPVRFSLSIPAYKFVFLCCHPLTSASEFEATNYSAVLQKQVTGWEVKNEGDILKLHRAWKVTTQIFTLLVGIM